MPDPERLIDTYCSAWSEPDATRRGELLATVWAEGGTYSDPSAQVAGRAALVAHIGGVQRSHPAARVVRTSRVDAHHDLLRFTWKMQLADGTSLPEGTDFGELDGSGKLSRVVGFFGTLKASP